MAAGRYNFTIEQGATVDFEVRYTDISGSAIDLEGYQARMQIRPAPGAKQVYMTLSSSLGPCGSGLNMSGSVNDPDYPKNYRKYHQSDCCGLCRLSLSCCI